MKPSLIVWDLETVPDFSGFAAANNLVGRPHMEVRAAIGRQWRPIHRGYRNWLAEAGFSDICVQYGAAAGGATTVVARKKD